MHFFSDLNVYKKDLLILYCILLFNCFVLCHHYRIILYLLVKLLSLKQIFSVGYFHFT